MPRVELKISPEEVWKPKQGLLGLPREVRDMIYELVLVEPPKWERRHKATCEWCPRNTKTFERPVFDHWSSCSCIGDRVCKCIKRSLWLLCVNKQLHHEAAPIFWMRNTFCFDRANEFVVSVGEALREEYVRLIQHVSILGVHWEEYQQASWPDCCYRWNDNTGSMDMWEALKRCSGLKTLEIGPEKLYCPEWNTDLDLDDDEDVDYYDDEDKGTDLENYYDYTDQVKDLREHLPLLEEFAFSRMLVYDGNPETSARSLEWYHRPSMDKRHMVYVKVRKVISLEEISTPVKAKEASRSFRTNYLVHVMFAIETSLLGLPAADFSTSMRLDQPFKYAFTQELSENNTNFELKLRDKTTTQVRLLGLPITKRTHLRHLRERWKEDARRKKEGKPLLGAVRSQAIVDERKATKKYEAESQLEQSRRVELEIRAINEEQREKDKARDKRREKRRERVEVKQTAKVNEFIKKAERKRVPRPK